MNTLSIPISCIGDAGYALDECALVSSIQPPGVHSLPVETVSVKGHFECMGEEILFRGSVSGVFTEACCRCLLPAQAAFHVDVAWVFVEGPELTFNEIGHIEDEDAQSVSDEAQETERPRHYQGHAIDLGSYVWEEVVFAYPSRFLCKDACKGLCPQCGANLNLEACRCATPRQEEPIGNRGLAGLATLFPDLAPKTCKE